MYTLPQEIEVWYIIPAIRKELAHCLIKKHKITYEKAGKILGITKVAISHYLGNKRATKVKLHKEAINEVCKSCSLIINQKSHATAEILRILNIIKEKNLLCEICDDKVKGKFTECKEIKIKYKV